MGQANISASLSPGERRELYLYDQLVIQTIGAFANLGAVLVLVRSVLRTFDLYPEDIGK